jgi:hypothetical protein
VQLVASQERLSIIELVILVCLATTGHCQKAKPTLQRKLFTCIVNTCCLKHISTIINLVRIKC